MQKTCIYQGPKVYLILKRESRTRTHDTNLQNVFEFLFHYSLFFKNQSHIYEDIQFFPNQTIPSTNSCFRS